MVRYTMEDEARQIRKGKGHEPDVLWAGDRLIWASIEPSTIIIFL
jgi:hypothetical protein